MLSGLPKTSGSGPRGQWVFLPHSSRQYRWNTPAPRPSAIVLHNRSVRSLVEAGTPRVLLVDDDPSLTRILADGLTHRGFDVTVRHGVAEALAAIHDPGLQVIVSDLRMPAGGGLELCRGVQAARPDLPVVILTAFGTLESAIDVLRVGAFDLLVKPIDSDLLAHGIRRAIAHRTMGLELRRLRKRSTEASGDEDLIGRSPAMQEVRDLIGRVAPSTVSVLITGETGTGKEVVAKLIHRRSGRTGPWVAVNCAAIPEALLESELFGHVRGAFTGATEHRQGLLVRAEGGTLFLDELSEMPLPLQAKLLRAIQERMVRPVGADREVALETRILAATNRDVEQAVADGQLREDLVFRLAVVTLELPPLRQRALDILDLAHHFVRAAAVEHDRNVTGLTPQAAERLLNYAWPGNVRELYNCVERAVVLARYETLTPEDLPDRIREHTGAVPGLIDDEHILPLAEVERRYVRHVLEVTGGNKSVAARLLGIDRKTVLKRS